MLVVDDDPDVRRFIADTLDALGYSVMEAENGFAGLAALERSTPTCCWSISPCRA